MVKQRKGEEKMTAIECVSKELKKIQKSMSVCISPEGYVYNYYRYRYQELVRLARSFKDSKDFLEQQIRVSA